MYVWDALLLITGNYAMTDGCPPLLPVILHDATHTRSSFLFPLTEQ